MEVIIIIIHLFTWDQLERYY